jgi:hypothetical protein
MRGLLVWELASLRGEVATRTQGIEFKPEPVYPAFGAAAGRNSE